MQSVLVASHKASAFPMKNTLCMENYITLQNRFIFLFVQKILTSCFAQNSLDFHSELLGIFFWGGNVLILIYLSEYFNLKTVLKQVRRNRLILSASIQLLFHILICVSCF